MQILTSTTWGLWQDEITTMYMGVFCIESKAEHLSAAILNRLPRPWAEDDLHSHQLNFTAIRL